MNNLDYSFLQEDMVYRMLTRGGKYDLKNWGNVLFIQNNSSHLIVFLDKPELSWNVVFKVFPRIKVIQEGHWVTDVSDLDTSKEALVLCKDTSDKSKLVVFLVREV